jgi:acyl carrier protein
MTHDQIRASVFEVLAGIAPEAEPGAIADDVPLRDQVDIDSMDFLNLMIGLHDALGVDIAESDYARVATIGGLVRHIDGQLATTEGASP